MLRAYQALIGFKIAQCVIKDLNAILAIFGFDCGREDEGCKNRSKEDMSTENIMTT